MFFYKSLNNMFFGNLIFLCMFLKMLFIKVFKKHVFYVFYLLINVLTSMVKSSQTQTQFTGSGTHCSVCIEEYVERINN